MTETIAIVGANLSGGRAAQALRAEGFAGDIVLIGAEAYPPYERPPLSKEVLLRKVQPERTYLMTEGEWEDRQVDLRLATTVNRIIPTSRELELSDGKVLRVDKVLLCTGGHVRRLQVPGTDLKGVEYLRTIDDAIAIRDRLGPDAPVVVIGGGFIGAEVAACARVAGSNVTMLEVGKIPMFRVLGRELGSVLMQFHQDRGVRIATQTTVDRIEGSRSVSHVITTDGERIEAQLVVVGIGILPAVELAQCADVATSNGIVVDEFCHTSLPGIWAAGDVANHPNPILGERLRLEHWQNAQNQGTAVARSMMGKHEPFREVPWFWSDQYDLNIQMFGHPHPGDSVVFRGDPVSSSFSAFYLRNRAMRAAVGVNRPREVRFARRYIESGQPLNPAELADESSDLRNLSIVRNHNDG